MKVPAPLIDARDQAKLLEELRRMVPGYTPEWSPGAPGKAWALMQIFARYMEVLNAGLNQAPERGLLAFLDMLGTSLLPARAARAPLVFSLMDDSPVDVTLPAGSEAAAPAQPLPPSPLHVELGQQNQPQPAIFATTQTITLSRGRLATLYSIRPGSDEYADHSAHLTAGFSLFEDMELTEHAIYLGHDELFALAGDITVLLSFTLEKAAERSLKTAWEYLSEAGWLPFESEAQDDTTQGMQRDGQIALRRECGPDAKKETFFERSSYWLRGRLTTPLLPEGSDGLKTVPVINDVRARLSFNKAGILPDAAFTDAVPLDITKNFYPFGQQPVRYTTFYLACKEVFQRKGARVRLEVELSQTRTAQGSPKTEWEFYDGKMWSSLGIDTTEGASNFTAARGIISFLCPRQWEETAVNGVKNYWLRVRIDSGDYGLPVRMNLPSRYIKKVSEDRKTLTLHTNADYTAGEVIVITKDKEQATAFIDGLQGNDELVLTSAIPPGVDFAGGTATAPTGTPPTIFPASIQPPVISKLMLGYAYLTDPEAPDHCLSQNDFIFADHSEACRWPDQTFMPFRPAADTRPAVHFGFDRPLPVGLVSLYVDAPQAVESAAAEASPFVWEYRSERGWIELGVLDETRGFRRSGMIQFIGPPDAVAAPGLGGELFRIRARLKQGERVSALPLAGIWLNAVWAEHSAAIENEPAGLSDGNPGQTFFLRRAPVLEGEILEIQEWAGRGEHWQTAVQQVAESDLRFDRDPASGAATAVWVRWHQQPHLNSSGAEERHYMIERSRGLIRFGDGRRGMIPPAGSRISVSYRSGGGLAGNVPAGAISELRTGLPFLAGADNPVPASGGAQTESIDALRARGPQRLRHGNRAVSAADFEWLAREASPEVARVRCLSLTGPAGPVQRGWITLMAVPHSSEARPRLSPEFLRRVREQVERRAPAAVARHIRIIGPQYAPIRVRAEIAPLKPEEAARVEARVRESLNRFLHPLTGGPGGRGWDFGQAVYLSQIARVIEETPGVDYARRITLELNEQIFAEFVTVEADALVAAGDHELKLIVGED